MSSKRQKKYELPEKIKSIEQSEKNRTKFNMLIKSKWFEKLAYYVYINYQLIKQVTYARLLLCKRIFE